MADGESHRNDSAERMSYDDCLRDAEGRQRLTDKVRLGAGRPKFQARALAVTETRPVKRNNPIALFSLALTPLSRQSSNVTVLPWSSTTGVPFPPLSV